MLCFDIDHYCICTLHSLLSVPVVTGNLQKLWNIKRLIESAPKNLPALHAQKPAIDFLKFLKSSNFVQKKRIRVFISSILASKRDRRA